MECEHCGRYVMMHYICNKCGMKVCAGCNDTVEYKTLADQMEDSDNCVPTCKTCNNAW
jgi:hypothetical protein